MNFTYPTLRGTPIFFMSYLVVSSIQMGANIDYAIVITNRYMELRQKMPKIEAMKESLESGVPDDFHLRGIILAARQVRQSGSFLRMGRFPVSVSA